jgi:zinc/manganese transport system ATP-binding protein
MVSALTIRQLSVSLGRRHLFSCDQCNIGQGQFIGLLGANGVGKTTFLRVLLGLQKARYAALSVLNTPCQRGRNDISYLPQLKAQSHRLSVCAADLFASWRPGAFSRSEWQNRIRTALEQVEATLLATRPLSELSGGEYQRLMLAQSLLNHPRLLLLDEPLVGLDPKHQHNLVSLIVALKARLGITVICSTHELNPFINHFDSVFLIHQQHLRHGSAQQLLNTNTLSELYGCHLDVITHHGKQLLIAHPDSDPYV